MSGTRHSTITYMQGNTAGGATVNGNGVLFAAAGYDSAIQIEVNESFGGTATLAFQGSLDGATWYAVGYQQVDNTASPARAVANISVGASSKHVYQILDRYPLYRAVVSSVSSAVLTVRAYGVA